MTQADGQTPDAMEIRHVMRDVKPLMEGLEESLTAAARLTDQTRAERRYEALASLSEAHLALEDALHAARVTLGLPYERVIVVTYTAVFHAEDD